MKMTLYQWKQWVPVCLVFCCRTWESLSVLITQATLTISLSLQGKLLWTGESSSTLSALKSFSKPTTSWVGFRDNGLFELCAWDSASSRVGNSTGADNWLNKGNTSNSKGFVLLWSSLLPIRTFLVAAPEVSSIFRGCWSLGLWQWGLWSDLNERIWSLNWFLVLLIPFWNALVSGVDPGMLGTSPHLLGNNSCEAGRTSICGVSGERELHSDSPSSGSFAFGLQFWAEIFADPCLMCILQFSQSPFSVSGSHADCGNCWQNCDYGFFTFLPKLTKLHWLTNRFEHTSWFHPFRYLTRICALKVGHKMSGISDKKNATVKYFWALPPRNTSFTIQWRGGASHGVGMHPIVVWQSRGYCEKPVVDNARRIHSSMMRFEFLLCFSMHN